MYAARWGRETQGTLRDNMKRKPNLFGLHFQGWVGSRLGLWRKAKDEVEVVKTEVAKLRLSSSQRLYAGVQLMLV